MHHFGESNSSLLRVREGCVAAYLVCIFTYINEYHKHNFSDSTLPSQNSCRLLCNIISECV